MKLAAAQALADLAKEDVPDSVVRAYGGETDPLRPRVPDPQALRPPGAALGGAGGGRGGDRDRRRAQTLLVEDDYVRELENRLSRTRQVMHGVFDQATVDPEADRLPRGRDGQDRPRRQDPGRRGHLQTGSARRRAKTIEKLLAEHEVPDDAVEIVRSARRSATREVYAEVLTRMRWRNGVTAVTTPASSCATRSTSAT